MALKFKTENLKLLSFKLNAWYKQDFFVDQFGICLFKSISKWHGLLNLSNTEYQFCDKKVQYIVGFMTEGFERLIVTAGVFLRECSYVRFLQLDQRWVTMLFSRHQEMKEGELYKSYNSSYFKKQFKGLRATFLSL